jgi:alkylated DNA repair dioxygenase AlkB
MMLFRIEPTNDILPRDGECIYMPQVIPPEEAELYFQLLMRSIEWKHDEAFLFGKHHVTKRKVAWYGDHPFSYTYSRVSRTALSWTTELIALKRIIERVSGASFNSCLLNLYHSGDEGMGWHSDNEKTLTPRSSIASLSLGAERPFQFRHRETKELVKIRLEPGSLLLMNAPTQEHWLHRLPPSRIVKEARINLTFRRFNE